jgi:xanthine dehydrogenase molybdenum-binding subunit
MPVGERIIRVDAYDKVTGRAKYTDDLCPTNALTAKVLHSSIANGLVKSIDISQAQALAGVIKVCTCFDVPELPFSTAGHPWTADLKRKDVADRLLLHKRVRYYGDDIAAVVAEDDLTARKALKLIEVEYQEYPPLLTMEQAMAKGAGDLHEKYPGNILAFTTYKHGDLEEAILEPGLILIEGSYQTQPAQHCHMENPISYAWEEGGRLVVVSATQIPHILRRVIGQALGLPWGQVRVIKPYIGGGFGNRQDVLYEPLNGWLSLQVGGRCVRLELSREETFASTRCRHAMDFQIKSWFRPNGRLVARALKVFSNQGGYASHGHAIVANSMGGFRNIYQEEKALVEEAATIYTNLPAAGAMRGYGIPQVIFACEAHMDEAATILGIDPLELRRLNMIKDGYCDPASGIICHGNGLELCLARGQQWIGWKEKRRQYSQQEGMIRRGVGMAIFTYKSGLFPKLWEGAGARLMLNQDGSVQMQLGATEIGQGADTVFCQMAAQTLGFHLDKIHITSTQDTDISPYDPGAYGSRQSYAVGSAVRQTAEKLKAEILVFASKMLHRPAETLDTQDNHIVDRKSRQPLVSVAEVAIESLYNLEYCRHITAELSCRTTSNAFSLGACFAEVEVDLALCKIKILNIINVHDCGQVLNPALAEAQVHGGMSMSLGYTLSEQMRFDKQGRLLNGNFLDYKLPTALDMPELMVDFCGSADPTGPYGNKSLGEPPAIPPAPAIRNAIYQATGWALSELPLTPQSLFEKLKFESSCIKSR